MIVGYFLEGRTSQELARFLGVTESRVSQLRSEALAMLEKASRRSTTGASGRRAGGPGRPAQGRLRRRHRRPQRLVRPPVGLTHRADRAGRPRVAGTLSQRDRRQVVPEVLAKRVVQREDLAWAVVDAAPDGVLAWMRWGIVLANRQAATLFGYEEGVDRLIGRSVDELLPRQPATCP